MQTGDVKKAGLYLRDFDQTYSDAGLAQSKIWPIGTLCITVAANIAETSILDIEACFPDSVIGFIADPEKADARFVKYLFDAALKMRFQSFTQGAAQDNLSQAKLLSIKFDLYQNRLYKLRDRRYPLRLRRPDREQPAADCVVGGGGAAALPRMVRPLPLPRPRTRQDR